MYRESKATAAVGLQYEQKRVSQAICDRAGADNTQQTTTQRVPYLGSMSRREQLFFSFVTAYKFSSADVGKLCTPAQVNALQSQCSEGADISG
jgi:predicted secreted protein